MFGLIKKVFFGLLTGLTIGYNHTLINLHPNKCSQESHYHPFAVILERCVGSCNTLNNLLIKYKFFNKAEDLNLSVYTMITGINESKTLAKHLLSECKCKFD